MAVCRSFGIIVHKAGEIPGYLLVLDFTRVAANGFQHLICIYAPPDPCLRGDFFQEVFTYVSDQTILLGDFNSVTDQTEYLDTLIKLLYCFMIYYWQILL